MIRTPEGNILYHYRVAWKIYDDLGRIIESNDKQFSTMKEARDFSSALKKRIPISQSADITIINIDTNQVIEVLNREKGKRNFSVKFRRRVR